MASLSEKQIEIDLKDIENDIKNKKSFTRADIQKALDKLYGKKLSPDSKKEILKKLISRTDVKKIGISNTYTTREELSLVDKTYGFLNDLNSYKGFIEKE